MNLKKFFISLIFSILFNTGCAFMPGQINSWKQDLPSYMQENISEVKIEYSHILNINKVGWVEYADPIIHLHPLASKRFYLHEAMHSFEAVKFLEPSVEWDNFAFDYVDINYSEKLPFYCSLIPAIQIPVKDAPNLYAKQNHWENTAETFVFWMQKKKTKSAIIQCNIKTIEIFTNGGYQ